MCPQHPALLQDCSKLSINSGNLEMKKGGDRQSLHSVITGVCLSEGSLLCPSGWWSP